MRPRTGCSRPASCAGQTIGVCIANSALHCVIVSALNRMGCIGLSLPGSAVSGGAIPVPSAVTLDGMIVEDSCTSAVPANAVRVGLDWMQAAKEKVVEWQGPGFLDPEDVTHYSVSSGTTGTPKVISFSMRQLESRMFRTALGVLAQSRPGNFLHRFGMDIAMGYGCTFTALWYGGTAWMGWPDEAVFELISRNKIEWLAAAPIQYQMMLERSDPSDFDLSSLRAAISIGGLMSKPLIESVRAKICPQLITEYGSTEVGLLSFGPLQTDQHPGQCGVLFPFVHAEVVDEDDEVLGPGEEGILRFRCQDMATSYVNDPEATALAFRDGWFYPGDLGIISDDRALVLTGRSAERINAGGVKIAPEAIEAALRFFEGIRDCAGFSVPGESGIDRVWAAIVYDGAIDIEKLQQHCSRALGPRAPVSFLSVKELPRNRMGKVVRKKLAELALEQVATQGKGGTPR